MDAALLARRLPGLLVAGRRGRRRSGLGHVRLQAVLVRLVERAQVVAQRLQLGPCRALAQAAQQRAAPLASVAVCARRVGQALADPALVGGPRSAEVAHQPARAAGDEGLGLLPAQQRAPADVAGHCGMGGRDGLARHP
jgi:hypothetical protein